ncbi:MAG TPA: thiolase family protein [Bacillota bacterium]|nr:thiolase family protein [Bacillota bacterium]
MQDVYVVMSARSAVARKDGLLANVRSDELLADVLDELMVRANVDKSFVEDVIIGCVTQVNEQAMNIARTASLIAGFPEQVPGVTIDRQCGSSQQAVHFGAQAIAAGDMDVVIAGGVESMTRSPMFSNIGQTKHSPRLTEQYEIVHQGISAEKIADRWKFSRQALDEFAYLSHNRALNAIDEGKFTKEIIPLKITNDNNEQITFETDEGPRRDTSVEVLSSLKPVFKEKGKITAGNASQMSDGASAVLLMSGKMVQQLGIKPQAKIIARTVVGSDPTLMLTGPIAATRQVLKRANLSIDDIDRYEVNEAFASVPLAWLEDTQANPQKLNVNGGAIALGHPLGATGTRLITTLLHELERIDGKYGLVAICEGMGMANATIFERVN